MTLGYTFSEHLAIEVGFLDAGSPRFESTRGFLCADPDLCQVRAKQATEAATVAAFIVGAFEHYRAELVSQGRSKTLIAFR